MPLLDAEPPLFPLDLFDDKIDQAVVQDKTWWVLHTKPRQEKSLARELFRREVPFYLPQVLAVARAHDVLACAAFCRLSIPDG